MDSTIALPRVLADTRTELSAAIARLASVPDAALERPWRWRGEEVDVRYGLYRALEAIEAAGVEVDRTIGGAAVPRSPASYRIAPATVARWELHGLLATLPDSTLDADPGGGEWTVRQTLGHIVASQRGYGWASGWWLQRAQDDPDFPRYVPDDVAEAAGLPEEDAEGAGSLAEIRARLDEVLDEYAYALGSVGDAELGRRARWSGIAVDIGFRFGRWSSHIGEHTVQVDKTLAMLGREPSEVERVIRLVHRAYGRLEALVFPLPDDALARPDPRGVAAAEILEALAAELRADAESVGQAAAG